ncbi:MAG: hypothetical protein ER33_00795 [Cyanobium sp. CACIAM 14]|nr:MAG: hypothetical protein ER33_00795 [Cyanobium sp. CACIAM 14]
MPDLAMKLARIPSVSAKTLLATLGALLLGGTMGATASPVQAAPRSIYGFGCFRAAGNYYLGLGPMAQPSGSVAMNPSSVPPLKGSGSVAVARITSSIGSYAVDRRCSTIATRLTNLAMATGNATPTGIINLTRFLVPGQIGEQQVIAIDRLTLGDVVATVGNGMTAQQALDVFGRRIRRVAARQAVAEALQDGDIVIFEFVEIRR